MGGGVRQSIGYPEIHRIVLPLPPIEEQQTIIEYCYSEQSKIEQMIVGIKDEIALVQELRTKTIADVVTGKVDVRGIEIPEFEPEADDMFESDDNEKGTAEDGENNDEEVEK